VAYGRQKPFIHFFRMMSFLLFYGRQQNGTLALIGRESEIWMDRLSELNCADEQRAITLIAPLIERAPEVARRVARRRPFQNPDNLSQAIRGELLELSDAERVDLFRAHPELAPDNPLSMTSESQSEQARLNLTSNESEYRARLSDLNTRYREKHGFPFITALVRHSDIESVLAEFEARLTTDRQSEIQQAIDQIATVSLSRVRASFGASDIAKSDVTTTKT
jgi:OHCU decarboxylase